MDDLRLDARQAGEAVVDLRRLDAAFEDVHRTLDYLPAAGADVLGGGVAAQHDKFRQGWTARLRAAELRTAGLAQAVNWAIETRIDADRQVAQSYVAVLPAEGQA